MDSHSKKPRRAPSPTPSASSVTTNASDTTTAASTPDSQNSFGDFSDESQSQGNTDLEIETPSMEELEKAENGGKVSVFARMPH